MTREIWLDNQGLNIDSRWLGPKDTEASADNKKREKSTVICW